MDSKHQLNAPNNDSLKTIEQISDRSSLSTIYPNAQKEWEGKDILSAEERSTKRDKEQLKLTTAIRKRFAVVGVLVPIPLALAACLLSVIATYVTMENLGFLLLPIILGIGAWILVSYLVIRQLHAIFYHHALRTAPFVIILLCLLGLSTQLLFILFRPLGANSIIGTTLAVSGGLFIASIVLSGILLLLWVSPRLRARTKFNLIAVLAVALVASSAAVTLM